MEDDIDAEMRAALRVAGITVPPERFAIMRDAYIRSQEMMKPLDEPLAYTDEPAMTFHPGWKEAK
jgi:hypothetical protein